MSNWEMILMLIALTLGTQLCRFLPLVIPKSILANPLLQKLNKMLPLVIMILLVLTSLNVPDKLTESFTLFTAQILALLIVLLSYKWFKNTLVSVGLGIVSINVLLWVLA